MVLRRQDKVELTNEYSQILDKTAGIMVFHYHGLTVSQVTELRARLRESGAGMQVVKNRMLKRAVEGRPYEQINEILTGPNAVIFADEDDPITPAKILADFAKTHDAIEIKGAVVSDAYIGADQAKELAKMPTKDELYSKILGGIQAPATNLLGLFKASHNKIHGLLKAYAEKLEQDAA